ncbi:cytochrome P450 [Colletotrichum tofieldiae]|nr:cytochrome P450 [Colletotrichum tofieldiae]GKT74149.1 cytochrome P450 [Colletotrichum tofieldiae]
MAGVHSFAGDIGGHGSASSCSNASGLLLVKLVGLVAVVTFFVWEFRSWYRLRKIPGPFVASVSVLWQLKKAIGGTYHEHLNDVARKYDPDSLRKMSAVRSPYTKGDFYDSGRITPGVDNVVSMRDEHEHKAMRARMAPARCGATGAILSFGS